MCGLEHQRNLNRDSVLALQDEDHISQVCSQNCGSSLHIPNTCYIMWAMNFQMLEKKM